jgi:hypothetical protein
MAAALQSLMPSLKASDRIALTGTEKTAEAVSSRPYKGHALLFNSIKAITFAIRKVFTLNAQRSTLNVIPPRLPASCIFGKITV